MGNTTRTSISARKELKQIIESSLKRVKYLDFFDYSSPTRLTIIIKVAEKSQFPLKKLKVKSWSY